MLAAAAALALSALAVSATPGTLDAGERVALGLILLAPGGSFGDGGSRSELIRTVDAALRDDTGLEVLAYDESTVVEECPRGGFACFVDRVARPDYRRARGGASSFGELLPALREKPRLYPRFLLLLSIVALEGSTRRVSAALIDCERALEVIDAAGRGGSSAEELEDRILERAVRAQAPAPAGAITAAAAGDTTALVRSFLLETSRPAFEEAEVWAPYGAIELRLDVAGALELDGRALGEVSAGTTRIARVLPGVRQLHLQSAGLVERSGKLRVERGKIAVLALEAPASNISRDLRVGLFWGGLAVAAAGAGITAYALAASPSRILACPRRGDIGGGCGEGEFLNFGSPGGSPGFGAPHNGSGIAIAPLGLSLLGAGASWSIASWLAGDSDTFPWLELAAGGVVLVSTYVLTTALDGTNRSSP